MYYIDGHKIAESSDYENNYTITHIIDNLSIGEHEVDARCTRNFKDIDIDEHITPYKLTISL